MSTSNTDTLAGEVNADPGGTLSADDQTEISKNEQLRDTLAAVYSFVRDQEINRSIDSFTLDHFIDQAKRRIQSSGQSVTDPTSGDPFDSRPSQLDALKKLQTDFNNSLSALQKLADQANKNVG